MGTLNVIPVIWYKNPLGACVSNTTILTWWPKFHIDCEYYKYNLSEMHIM